MTSQDPSTPPRQQNVELQQSLLRRSSRNTTPTQRPGMVIPSADSRQAIIPHSPGSRAGSRAISSSTNLPSKSQKNKNNKRKFNSSVSHTTTPIPSTSNKNCNRESESENREINNSPEVVGTTTIDLAQDSDEGNAQIKRRKHNKNKDEGYDRITSYFGEPYHLPKDVSNFSKYVFNLCFPIDLLSFVSKGCQRTTNHLQVSALSCTSESCNLNQCQPLLAS